MPIILMTTFVHMTLIPAVSPLYALCISFINMTLTSLHQLITLFCNIRVKIWIVFVQNIRVVHLTLSFYLIHFSYFITSNSLWYLSVLSLGIISLSSIIINMRILKKKELISCTQVIVTCFLNKRVELLY